MERADADQDGDQTHAGLTPKLHAYHEHSQRRLAEERDVHAVKASCSRAAHRQKEGIHERHIFQT